MENIFKSQAPFGETFSRNFVSFHHLFEHEGVMCDASLTMWQGSGTVTVSLIIERVRGEETINSYFTILDSHTPVNEIVSAARLTVLYWKAGHFGMAEMPFNYLWKAYRQRPDTRD